MAYSDLFDTAVSWLWAKGAGRVLELQAGGLAGTQWCAVEGNGCGD
jgi:hypothetical protein